MGRVTSRSNNAAASARMKLGRLVRCCVLCVVRERKLSAESVVGGGRCFHCHCSSDGICGDVRRSELASGVRVLIVAESHYGSKWSERPTATPELVKALGQRLMHPDATARLPKHPHFARIVAAVTCRRSVRKNPGEFTLCGVRWTFRVTEILFEARFSAMC